MLAPLRLRVSREFSPSRCVRLALTIDALAKVKLLQAAGQVAKTGPRNLGPRQIEFFQGPKALQRLHSLVRNLRTGQIQTKKVVPDLDEVDNFLVAELGIREVDFFDQTEVQVAQAGSRNGGVRQIDRIQILAIFEDRQRGIGNLRTPQDGRPQVRQLDHGGQIGIADGDVAEIDARHGNHEIVGRDRFRLQLASGGVEQFSRLGFFAGLSAAVPCNRPAGRGSTTPENRWPPAATSPRRSRSSGMRPEPASFQALAQNGIRIGLALYPLPIENAFSSGKIELPPSLMFAPIRRLAWPIPCHLLALYIVALPQVGEKVQKTHIASAEPPSWRVIPRRPTRVYTVRPSAKLTHLTQLNEINPM